MLKKLGTLLLGATLAFGTPDSKAQPVSEPDLPPTPTDSLKTLVQDMDPFGAEVVEHTAIRLHPNKNSNNGSHTGDTIRLQTLEPQTVYHEIAHGVDTDTTGPLPHGNILQDPRYDGPTKQTLHEHLKRRIQSNDYLVEREMIDAATTTYHHKLLHQTAQDIHSQHDTLRAATDSLLATDPDPGASTLDTPFSEKDTTVTTSEELDSLLTRFTTTYEGVAASSERADSLRKTITCKAQSDTAAASFNDFDRLESQLKTFEEAMSGYDTATDDLREAYDDLHRTESDAPPLPPSAMASPYVMKVSHEDAYSTMRYFQELTKDGSELYARFVSSLYTDGKDLGVNEFYVHDEDLEFLAKQQWNGEPMLKQGISSYQSLTDTPETTRPSQKLIEALDITVEPGFLQTYYSHNEEYDSSSSINCAKYLHD